MDLPAIQEYLKARNIDGWLLADFHGRNTVAVDALELTGMITRRSFYFIPADGKPTALVNKIEEDKFEHLPGVITAYHGYRDLENRLAQLLNGRGRIAMEYSPNGRLPYVGLVDAGTIELVRGHVAEVISSADLVANFQARLSDEQVASHRTAARNLLRIKSEAFRFIANQIESGARLTEYDVVRFILDEFNSADMETEESPICAVDSNAGNPHYEPPANGSAEIRKGCLVLIDLWAKLRQPFAAYADITWMAYAGAVGGIPQSHKDRFAVLVEARDAAVAYVRDRINERSVCGAEADDCCRRIITEAGYGDRFTHRTGHSIGRSVHGPGPNMDNLETEDRRVLQQGHLFSIEPGIYMPDAGFRTEIDVLIGHDGAEVTTLPLQTEITPLF
jgi:Xaa-Pro aminopeptidase